MEGLRALTSLGVSGEEIVAINGKTGSGKTTVSLLLSGVPLSGEKSEGRWLIETDNAQHLN